MGQHLELKETVLRLAKWQLNTLGLNGVPLQGLFARENDSNPLQSICLSYLLFRAASLFDSAFPFIKIAEIALKSLQEQCGQTREKIDPLWPLIEVWLSRHFTEMESGIKAKLPNSKSQEECSMPNPDLLSEYIYDPSTALVGFRSFSQHVICTLHGEKTGLGSIRKGDVEIITYGPQYIPLADCNGFGIEGNALSDQGMRRSIIEWRPHTFALKRMRPYGRSALFFRA